MSPPPRTIGAQELTAAVAGHVARTDVSGLEPLFDALGVDAGELHAMIAALWDVREPGFAAAELVTPERSLYGAAFLDGFIIGVRAARGEPGSPQ